MHTFLQDLRYGLRTLRKSPGFTAIAVLTLALGIGANTAMFSLINAVLLRALPYPEPDRLVVLWADNPSRQLGVSELPPMNADIAAWREHTQHFERIAAFMPRTADLADGGDPERVGAAGVTEGLFETLGVAPLFGRTFAPEEDKPGGAPVVMISYGLWQRRFGADPGLVGKAISVNGSKRTVIGIMPPDFDFPRSAEWPTFFSFAGRTDVWLPLAFSVGDWQAHNWGALVALGRLKSGNSLRQARAEMDAFAARQAIEHPDSHKDLTLNLVSLRHQVAGKSQTALLMLFASVGLLLLIACVNVANLLLARNVARQKELAVRAALGAGRARLMRQLFTESLLLSAFGCGLGLLVADACLNLFPTLNPTSYSRLDEASIDPVVLGFTALITLATGVAFGLTPTLQASKLDLRRSLHEGGRGAAGSIRQRVRGYLVASEVALAIILLASAGLMVRSFLRVQAVQPGFQPDAVLAFEVQLPEAGYAGSDKRVAFFQQLLARLEAVPGVRAAGAISYLPLDGGENIGGFTVDGAPPVRPGEEPVGERRSVTPGYFTAMGIPLQGGRLFDATDAADGPRVVVINETMARQFFPSADPVGQHLRVLPSESGPWRTVIGVVADVKSRSLEADIRPQIYLPHTQWPWGGMTVVLLGDGNPLALASAARAELKALDPLLPAAKMRSMQQVVTHATSMRRFSMALLVLFAGAALLLTVVGIYGVVAFLAGRQVREIGIRIALGASRMDVLRLILQQGMKPVAIGGVVGLAGSLGASRMVAGQLYGISPSDPLTLAVIIVLLMAVALLACYIPARRAAKVDPMTALRYE